MAEIANENIVIITKDLDSNVIIANPITGKKIVTYNYISMNNQCPKEIKVLHNNDFIILGEASGVQNCRNILHYWKLDDAKIGYQNIDFLVGANPVSIYYEPKLIDVFNDILVISGVFKDKIFVWKWKLNDISENPEEIFYDKIDANYNDLLLSKYTDNGIYFVINNKLVKYTHDGSEILENLILNNFLTTNKVVAINDKFVAIDKKDVVYYTLQKYSYYPEIKFNILDDPSGCNNINVFISSSSGKERFSFYDAKTLKQIVPDFYGLDSDNNFIISIKNCEYTNIDMIAHCDKESLIKGIVINLNREYISE
jgi:hypothetical protein